MNRKAVLLLLLCGLVCCNASYLSSLSNLYGRARSLLSGTSHVKAIALAGDFNVTLQALPSGLVLVNEGVTLTAKITPAGEAVIGCRFEDAITKQILFGCSSQPVVNGAAACQWLGIPEVPASGEVEFEARCRDSASGFNASSSVTVPITSSRPQLTVTVAAGTDKEPTDTPFLITATAFTTRSPFTNQSQAASAGAKPLAPPLPVNNGPLSDREVTFTIASGSGNLTPVLATTRSPRRAELAANRATISLTVTTDVNGIAQVWATGTSPGPLGIVASLKTGSVITTTSLGAITIFDPVAPGVASVTLSPALTEAHLGEPVSLTATALDAEGNPFAGAKVCLVSAGQAQLEYYPHPQRPVKSLCGVTDAQGKVTLSFTSKIPGTVGVVAAALQSGRGSVVSPPSHVMFWGHEHRQDNYNRREGWWRDEAYGAVATKLTMQAGTPAVRALP